MAKKKLSKWQKEVLKLEEQAGKDLEKDLKKTYEEILKDVRRSIRAYGEDFEKLPYYKQVRLGHLKQLQNEVVELLNTAEPEVRRRIIKFKEDELIEGYFQSMYQIEMESMQPIDFLGIDRKFVRAAVEKPVSGQKLSTRLYKYRNRLAKKAQSAISAGISQGMAYEKIADQIRSITEANYKQSIRIARTEGGRLRSEAKNLAYQEAIEKGVEFQEMWVSALDSKTRGTHQALDGQRVDVGEQFTSPSGAKATAPGLFGIAEEDINCRCTKIAVFEGQKLTRRDGESDLIAYKNYNEWLSDRVGNDSGIGYNNGKKIEFAPQIRKHNLSRDEAINKLSNKFGMNIKETSRTKLSDYALNQTYSILEGFEDLYNVLPDKIPQVRAVTKSEGKNAIAWYSRTYAGDPVEFGINVSYFKNEDHIKSIVERGVKSGFYSNNSNANHIMVHEFGHHIDYQLSKVLGESFSEKIFNEMEVNFGDKYPKKTVARQISRYADSFYWKKGKHTESFAEIFAEAYGDTPREIAKDFKKEFERIAREVLSNVSNT